MTRPSSLMDGVPPVKDADGAGLLPVSSETMSVDGWQWSSVGALRHVSRTNTSLLWVPGAPGRLVAVLPTLFANFLSSYSPLARLDLECHGSGKREFLIAQNSPEN